MSKRNNIARRFKREAVELARRSGTSLFCQIAQEIGGGPSLPKSLGAVRREQAEKPFPGTGATAR